MNYFIVYLHYGPFRPKARQVQRGFSLLLDYLKENDVKPLTMNTASI